MNAHQDGFVQSLAARHGPLLAPAPAAEPSVHVSPQSPQLPRLPQTPPDVPADVAAREWDDLLSAVKARLKQTVGEPLVGELASATQDAAGRVRASVLECVAALDQLHTTLTHEFARRQTWHETLPALPALSDGAFLRQRLDAALAAGGPGALLFIDLDDFRAIDHSHGRDVGDELLRIVAARLARAVRGDDTVSRVGLDGFAVLLEQVTDSGRLIPLACKLFDAISAPLAIGNIQLTLQPSLGIAAFPNHGNSFDELLANADAAMRRAQRNHSGYALFDRFADG